MEFKDFTLTGTYNELALSSTQTRGDSASIIAGGGSQYAPNSTVFMRFIL